MSTDPPLFEDDLDAIAAQAPAEEAASAAAAPGKSKKKEKKPKAPKAKKEKVVRPKAPRSSGGLVQRLYRWFPDLYTSLLGLTTLALLIAVVLLLVEVLGPYGGQFRPTGGLGY